MRLLPEWFRLLFEHRHEYEKTAMFKRRCLKCGRVEWLFENKFPRAGEAKYEWRVMHQGVCP